MNIVIFRRLGFKDRGWGLIKLFCLIICSRLSFSMRIVAFPIISLIDRQELTIDRCSDMYNSATDNMLQLCRHEISAESEQPLSFINFVSNANQQLVEIVSSAVTAGTVQATVTVVTAADQLTYFQTMTAGALSRSMAQTIMHPANTYKTLLQLKGSGKGSKLLTQLTPERLFRGVDAQFLLSIPHGAFYFFVIDQVVDVLSSI